MSKEVFKPVIISIAIGLIFGLIFSNYIISTNQSDFSPVLTTIILTSVTTLISGLSSIYALIADKKLRKIKWKNEIVRRITSFILILITLTLIIYFLSNRIEFFKNINIPNNIGIYILFFGFSIGFLIIYIDYINFKKEQRIVLLEQENKFLSEISYKDKLYQETVKSLIISEERNRIAKELHDSIAQSIYAINYMTRVLKKEDNISEQSLSLIENIEQATKQTIKDLRAVIKELTPSDIEKVGLVKAIKEMAGISKELYKIIYSLHIDYKGDLTPTQEVAVYRIVQESINNIEKHSKAKKVSISLMRKNEKICLLIKDDGLGFKTNETSGRYGITNMKERAVQTGGELDISSNESGTTIKSCWKSIN